MSAKTSMYEETTLRKQNQRTDFPEYDTQSIVTTRPTKRVVIELCPICKLLYDLEKRKNEHCQVFAPMICLKIRTKNQNLMLI